MIESSPPTPTLLRDAIARIQAIQGALRIAPEALDDTAPSGTNLALLLQDLQGHLDAVERYLSLLPNASERPGLGSDPAHVATALDLQAQRYYMVGQVTVQVLHDFGNLMNGVLGYMMLALDDLAPTHPARDLVAAGAATATTAEQVRSWLLAFVRGEAEALHSVDLNTLITQALPVFRRLIGAHITITLALAPDLPLVAVDPNRIAHVLLNLILNSRDALDGCGEITIATARDATTVSVSVADTGGGIPSAMLERIFEPYFTTKPPGKGTGLGLATCRQIVAGYGGTISVNSALGAGTTVRLTLPADL